MWKPREEAVTIEGPRKGVIDCFFIGFEDNLETSLMVCGADGSIKLWSVKAGAPTNLILDDSGLCLICVDLASSHQWLAQGTTNHGVQIVQIQLDTGSVISFYLSLEMVY